MCSFCFICKPIRKNLRPLVYLILGRIVVVTDPDLFLSFNFRSTNG